MPLHSGMAYWPGDPPVLIERLLEIAQGDPANVSTLSMSAHTGTHIDAPLHYIENALGIDAMPLEATSGTTRVVELFGDGQITPSQLMEQSIRSGERLLLKTRNSRNPQRKEAFYDAFACLSREAADYLASLSVRAVGIDYLSIGSPGPDGDATHHVLLQAGIWIIEGLDLSAILPGQYEMVCLPLRIVDGDGAPARAALRLI